MSRFVVRCLVQYGLGLGLLAWVVASHWHITTAAGDDVGLAAALRGPVHLTPLAAAALLCLAANCLSFVRWFFLVRAQQLPFTLLQAFRLGMIGNYFNAFLPGSVGGDLVKASCLVRGQRRRVVAVATVLVDRVIGLWGLLTLGLLTGAAYGLLGGLDTIRAGPAAWVALQAVYLAAAGAVVLLGGFWLGLRLLPAAWDEAVRGRLRRYGRVGGWLAELWHAAWMYRGQDLCLLGTLGLAMIGHTGLVLAFYFSALTLRPADAVPDFEAHLVFVPAGMIIQAGVPAPGGVGGGEYAFGALYEMFGATFAGGVLASLVARCVAWVWGFVGYLLYWRLRPGEAAPAEEAAEPAPTPG